MDSKRPKLKTVQQAIQNIVEFPDQNLLGGEKSPYLLQHADNPVHWYPWTEKAFAKAKAEDKPVFLSIGYSTCHWCHVMEHESFEDPKIAEIMNQYFVSIKVDREERPDLDNIYMKAVMSLTGSGGWPLSVFLTPDGKPFYGGTYFPPQSQWGMSGFKDLLLSVRDGWRDKREEVLRSSQLITDALQRGPSRQDTAGSLALNVETLSAAYRQHAQRFDPRHGGFGDAPKFPSSHNLSFLLRYWKRVPESRALDMVEKTLTEMANGGMYDQVGGGFHRYSTDARWHIPHFEKMLYDQAILTKTYLEAYQATKNEKYAQTAREVFEYVLRDMTDLQGGFYSAEDADSLPPEEFANMTPAGELSRAKSEGAFYLWGHEETIKHLGQELGQIFNYYYGIEPQGNALFDPHGEFKGKNILYVAHSLDETARKFKKAPQEIQKILYESKSKLFEIRQYRPRPHRDDKVLVDWNGLMISSLAFGSRVLNEPRYRQAAEKSAQFILSTLVTKDGSAKGGAGRLLHRYRDGEAGILGTLEDYAFFIHGLIDLYEATFTEEYLKEAKRWTEDMIRLFWDGQAGGFFFTATDAERLLFREKEIYDGALPSGNSIAALDLLRMGRLTLNRDWEKKAEQLFKAFSQQLASSTQSLIGLDFALGPTREIVITGEEGDPQTISMLRSLYDRFIPNKVVIFRPRSAAAAKAIIALAPFIEYQELLDDQTTAYICENYHCEFPTNDIKKFKELLDR